MSRLPSLFTRNVPSSLSQSSSSDPNAADGVASPAEQRDDAKRNFLKAMRPLPTQHYWDVYYDRQAKGDNQPPPPKSADGAEYKAQLVQLGSQIESVQDFWRYANNTPVDNIKMRESIYLFKSGFKPVWEDRRNINGGSWTFRVPKGVGKDVWTHVQLLAIGEQLQEVLDEGDQICGVGLSVRFNSHLISVWHRESDKKKSVDGILKCVLENLPAELRPKPDNYFYKKHADHAGFKAPPELQAVLDSQKAREAKARAAAETGQASSAVEAPQVQVTGVEEASS